MVKHLLPDQVRWHIANADNLDQEVFAAFSDCLDIESWTAKRSSESKMRKRARVEASDDEEEVSLASSQEIKTTH